MGTEPTDAEQETASFRKSIAWRAKKLRTLADQLEHEAFKRLDGPGSRSNYCLHGATAAAFVQDLTQGVAGLNLFVLIHIAAQADDARRRDDQ